MARLKLTCGGGGVGDETASRVKGETVERLATLQHPSVSVHGEGGENERKSKKTKVGGRRKRRSSRVNATEEEYWFLKMAISGGTDALHNRF